jgi:hypothetical protein
MKDKLGGKRKRAYCEDGDFTENKVHGKNKKFEKVRSKSNVLLNAFYRTNDYYSKDDGFYIEIKAEESNF